MIGYFAGAESNHYSGVLKDAGADSILQSAYYMKYSAAPNTFGFKNYLLDSGGFTALKKGENIELSKYINYINKYDIKLAINLDVPDIGKTFNNYDDLRKYTRAKILPVYHTFDYYSAHRKRMDECCFTTDYFCVAGLTRTDYTLAQRRVVGNYVFRESGLKIKIHGLAVTNCEMYRTWPFYSIDATTWLNVTKYGTMVEYKNFRIEGFESVRTSGEVNNAHQFLTKAAGLKKTIHAYMALTKDITRLWEARGIKWTI